MKFTDRGRADVLRGMAEAQTLLKRRMQKLNEQAQTIEVELNSLSKIFGALGLAIELIECQTTTDHEAGRHA